MENKEDKKPKKKILPLVMGLIIVSGTVYGIIKYRYSLHHEVTDDAQLENDISPVLSRVTGYVDKINFEENQLVQKGDTLIVLDNRDLVIKVEQAQAAFQNAEASVEVARANYATAVANVKTSKANIESTNTKVWRSTQDYKRYENLMKDSAISTQTFEKAKAEKDNSDALLSYAEGQQSSSSVMVIAAEKQITVAQSVVTQKKADLEFAKLQLSYSIITAPATGVASRKNVQPGQLVNAGSPLFAIVAENGAYVIANFKETQLLKMHKDQEAEITIDAYPDQPVKGKIYAFAPATGAKFSLLPPDNATGNFVKVVQRVPVKILLNNNKELADKLRPGMSVKVSVNTD